MNKARVFISYSNRDRKKVDTLKRKLEGLSYDSIVIADDREPLKALSQKVMDGIEQAEYFVPIITSHSIHTQWLNQEIGYAKAKSRKVLPVVQNGILEQLKGFIHKDLDLPFRYNSSWNNSEEERSFLECATDLIGHIDKLRTGNIKTILDIFTGRWKNEFQIDQHKGQEIFEIREGRKYFIDNVHWFNIEDFAYDLSTRRVSFRKVGVRDKREFMDQLRMIDDYCLEGSERCNLDDLTRAVRYTKEK